LENGDGAARGERSPNPALVGDAPGANVHELAGAGGRAGGCWSAASAAPCSGIDHGIVMMMLR
jgi:hypothetical protein